MKYLNLILLLICFNAYGQEWIDDSNFDNKINERSAFGDDQSLPVVVEFWAEFNDGNKFVEWNKLENVVYYRADITKCTAAKKKYKVRMVPTMIIFKDGIKETIFKAGLDLVLPAELEEIQESINEINNASKF
jgi:thioredoxin-like negative regulator of GroEL